MSTLTGGSATPAAAAATPSPEETYAAKFYEPAAPGDGYLAQAFRDQRETLTDELGLRGDEVTARQQNFKKMIATAGVEPLTIGARLYELDVRADLAAARGEPEPDAEQIGAWSAESRRTLRNQYGEKLAETWLDLAAKFVRAHPTLQTLMQKRGIGSRPDVVISIVEHVRAIGYR